MKHTWILCRSRKIMKFIEHMKNIKVYKAVDEVIGHRRNNNSDTATATTRIRFHYGRGVQSRQAAAATLLRPRAQGLSNILRPRLYHSGGR